QLHFQGAIRPLLHALQAATFAAVHDSSDPGRAKVVLGGGLAFLPEGRDAIDKGLNAYQAGPALELTYQYPGYGQLPMGNLLWVASGAALAGMRGITREDGLSDTIGVLVAYPRDEGLALLDREGSLPPDGAEIDGIIQMPNGEQRILL